MMSGPTPDGLPLLPREASGGEMSVLGFGEVSGPGAAEGASLGTAPAFFSGPLGATLGVVACGGADVSVGSTGREDRSAQANTPPTVAARTSDARAMSEKFMANTALQRSCRTHGVRQAAFRT